MSNYVLVVLGAFGLAAVYHFVHTSYTPLRLIAMVFLIAEAAVRQAAQTLMFAWQHYRRGYPVMLRSVKQSLLPSVVVEKVRKIS